jgi:hypothetical protein
LGPAVPHGMSLLSPVLRAAVAQQRDVQRSASICQKRAVGRPLIEAALRKPGLELTRDAVLGPALLFGRRHPRLRPGG